jgi:hypothetical protein
VVPSNRKGPVTEVWGLFQAHNLARPEGTQRAMQTLRIEGVEELVRALGAA